MYRFYQLPNTISQNDKDRFWSKVAITANPNTCWRWLDYIRPKGYGDFKLNRIIYKAHRLSYLMAYGDPKNLLVCHKCDNKSCVNPTHFFLGTEGDNIRDAFNKKRHPVGENHPKSKLKAKDVIKIRELHHVNKMTHLEIAKLYKSVSYQSITAILINQTWKHLL